MLPLLAFGSAAIAYFTLARPARAATIAPARQPTQSFPTTTPSKTGGTVSEIPSVAPSSGGKSNFQPSVSGMTKATGNSTAAPTGATTPSGQNISARGIAFIKEHEGRRLTAYRDSAGLPTIGYGHLIVAGDGLSINSTITEAQAEALLRADLATAINAVRSRVTAPLTQNQFDALVSLVFNIGAGAFRDSTLLRKLNQRDYNGARAEFARWNRAGGRVVQGLVNRRAAEEALFGTV